MIKLALPNGNAIVLVDMFAKSGSWDDVNRNVYRVTTGGDTVWRIGTGATADERTPYTNVSLTEAGKLVAYCWNGGEYIVCLDTGEIDRGTLVR